MRVHPINLCIIAASRFMSSNFNQQPINESFEWARRAKIFYFPGKSISPDDVDVVATEMFSSYAVVGNLLVPGVGPLQRHLRWQSQQLLVPRGLLGSAPYNPTTMSPFLCLLNGLLGFGFRLSKAPSTRVNQACYLWYFSTGGPGRAVSIWLNSLFRSHKQLRVL